jgi:hypothetical protein
VTGQDLQNRNLYAHAYLGPPRFFLFCAVGGQDISFAMQPSSPAEPVIRRLVRILAGGSAANFSRIMRRVTDSRHEHCFVNCGWENSGVRE